MAASPSSTAASISPRLTAISVTNNPTWHQARRRRQLHEHLERSRANPVNGSAAGMDGGFIVFQQCALLQCLQRVGGSSATPFRLDAGSTTPVLVDPTGTQNLPHFFGVDSRFPRIQRQPLFQRFEQRCRRRQHADQARLRRRSTTIPPSPSTAPIPTKRCNYAGWLGGFVDFAGSTYFMATTAERGHQLFKLDAAGVVSQVTEFRRATRSSETSSAASSSLPAACISTPITAPAATTSTSSPPTAQLTTVDLGTGGGTTNAGVEGGFQEFAGSLYFSSYTQNGYELVRLDADGVAHPYDINPGPGPYNSEAAKDGGFGVFPHTILNGGPGKDIVVGRQSRRDAERGSAGRPARRPRRQRCA